MNDGMNWRGRTILSIMLRSLSCVGIPRSFTHHTLWTLICAVDKSSSLTNINSPYIKLLRTSQFKDTYHVKDEQKKIVIFSLLADMKFILHVVYKYMCVVAKRSSALALSERSRALAERSRALAERSRALADRSNALDFSSGVSDQQLDTNHI